MQERWHHTGVCHESDTRRQNIVSRKIVSRALSAQIEIAMTSHDTPFSQEHYLHLAQIDRVQLLRVDGDRFGDHGDLAVVQVRPQKSCTSTRALIDAALPSCEVN